MNRLGVRGVTGGKEKKKRTKSMSGRDNKAGNRRLDQDSLFSRTVQFRGLTVVLLLRRHERKREKRRGTAVSGRQ